MRCSFVSTFSPFDQDLSPEAPLSKSQVFIVPWPFFSLVARGGGDIVQMGNLLSSHPIQITRTGSRSLKQ